MADTPPSVILWNGRIETLDPARPRVEALAVRGRRIVAVGSSDALLRLRGPATEIVDLDGLPAVPGFHDAHLHFIWFGRGLERADLAEAPSLDAALARAATAANALPAGAWLQGGGWNHDLWGGRLPTSVDLDRVAPDRPAILYRKDGHSVWVNRRALDISGITRQTADPPGGQIHRDADGELTGILAERATELVERHVPRPTRADDLRALKAATAVAQQFGVTSIHDMEGDDAFIAFQIPWHAGTLGVRVTMQLARDNFEQAMSVGTRSGNGDDLLRVGALKLFADGALGSRTAAMLAPYHGEPDNRGILVAEPEELRRIIAQASTHDIACAIHAIGDHANRIVLESFDLTRHLWQPRGLRQRIEHVQLLAPDDLPRLGRLGIIASMQPIHATQDMAAADRYWGDRSRFAYAWRSLLNAGTALAFGSDCPVETMDPLRGIYAAATRKREDGTPPGGWYASECLTVREALHAYTTGAAYAAGLDRSVGRLAPGMLADVTVLSDDIFAPPAERLLGTRVAATVFDGQVVYNQGVRVSR